AADLESLHVREIELRVGIAEPDADAETGHEHDVAISSGIGANGIARLGLVAKRDALCARGDGDACGEPLDDMEVRRTSGYGHVDRIRQRDEPRDASVDRAFRVVEVPGIRGDDKWPVEKSRAWNGR